MVLLSVLLCVLMCVLLLHTLLVGLGDLVLELEKEFRLLRLGTEINQKETTT